MTFTRRRLLRAFQLTLGSFLVVVTARSSAEAQYTLSPGPCVGGGVPEASCAWIYVKPSFVVKNLHPAVTQVSVWCSTKTAEPSTWLAVESARQTPIARDVIFNPSTTTGGALPSSMRMGILKTAISPGQVFTLTCELMLTRTTSTGVSTKALAVASAATPQTPTDTNWNQVATGSVVKWTQNVTFPSATP